MLPERRYRILRDAAPPHGTWCVVDVLTQGTLVTGLDDRAQADAVHAALCGAWWAGVDGVKQGTVII